MGRKEKKAAAGAAAAGARPQDERKRSSEWQTKIRRAGVGWAERMGLPTNEAFFAKWDTIDTSTRSNDPPVANGKRCAHCRRHVYFLQDNSKGASRPPARRRDERAAETRRTRGAAAGCGRPAAPPRPRSRGGKTRPQAAASTATASAPSTRGRSWASSV